MLARFSQLASQGVRSSWFDVGLLLLLVWGAYFVRLDRLPTCGEEPRWACGAAQMLETGDWIVPRQQGVVFPERPPMSSWAMALTALARGRLDDWAVRFPSALAVALTVLLIYGYASQFLTRLGAFAAAGMFATMGQVLQIGRMGESEALFTLWVSGSLMLWHVAYERRWNRAWLWSLGYGLAALGALVKGVQAPVYFAAVTWAWLLLQRDWRCLFSWQHLAGIGLFLAVVAAWQIPFLQATDWQTTRAVWCGLVGDRLLWQGLLQHVLTYPLETLICLLPWSALLILLADRNVRRALGEVRSMAGFLALALVLTYPSVWFASGARGRYYMPLYPCIAVLLAGVLERGVRAEAGSLAYRGWLHLTRLTCLLIGLGAGVVLLASLVTVEALQALRQPRLFAVLYAIASLATLLVLGRCRRSTASWAPQLSLAVLFGWLSLTYAGVVLNAQIQSWNHPRSAVLAVKARLPDPEQLVSFGPVDHRFVYLYEHTIREMPWPSEAQQVPETIQYFCYDRHRGDTAERRLNGRGRSWETTSGTLPFSWEEVAVVDCERRIRPNPGGVVVIGRILR